MGLSLKPITLKKSQAWIREHHRHNAPPRGWLFGVSVVDDEGILRGVAVIERPKARMLDNGTTAEVTRVCTDGARNACSMLYGAADRAARALGYTRIVTYTMEAEPGTSLRAVGWTAETTTADGRWDRPSRRRKSPTPGGRKIRWGRKL